MKLENCNPFLRHAQIQPAVLEGKGARKAYDHRLFYILEGTGSLLLEDRTLPLTPDMLLSWPFGVGYHFQGKLKVVVLNFDLTRKEAHRTAPICPPDVAEFAPSRLFDTTLLDELTQPLICQDGSRWREDILQLVHIFSEKDAVSDALSSALLKKFLVELLHRQENAPNAADRLVEGVRRYIRLHAAEITGNHDLGRAFGYHPVYLATQFRQKTGKSLHCAILEERISLSKRWLSLTDHSIDEIAESTGFSSRAHFCTVFKKFTNLSPLQYRAKNQ